MLRRFPKLNLLAAFILGCAYSQAATLDTIGVTLLRAMTTNLNGAGIRVAHPEASLSTNTPIWEVNAGNYSQLAGRFTYTSSLGSTNVFPNSLSAESWHANDVANFFYGQSGGVATNVAQVDCYDADYFITNYIFNVVTNDVETNVVFILAPMSAMVVNQSFAWNESTNIPTPTNYISVADQEIIDAAYDNYAETFGTIFVAAANNFSPNSTHVTPPGTSYNCISVGAYYNGTAYNSLGPTLDNGRCKPDITAISGATSFSTPQVTGAATVLMQAALRGEGGSDTNAAADLRTIKALLLNGAVKPANWTNSSSSPLDARYGAGVVNVFNTYKQLAGGKQFYCVSNTAASGTAHPPGADTNSVAAMSGWSFESISSSATDDAVNHYFFNISNGMATVTLVWNRQLGQSNINNLDLFLFDAANSNLVASSTSRVDNVEHLFLPKLPAGRYDLQVLKNGGTNGVSEAETYALAFAFVSLELNLAKSGTNLNLTWPVYPAGFRAEAATNLVSSVWSTNNLPAPAITNSMNRLTLNATNAFQFFRLRSPNF